MPLLNHNDLAKELIRRRDSQPRPPPARQPLGEVSGNETTLYELIERPPARSDTIKSRTKSWLPHRKDSGTTDKRVVSEPAMGVLGRLRQRRGSETGPPRREGNISESSGVDLLDLSGHSGRSTSPTPCAQSTTTSFDQEVHTSFDTSPSFIAFSSNSTSSTIASPAGRLQGQPNSPPSKRTLAPSLRTDNRSLGRAAATRAVTLEARLHPEELEQSPQSFEYPSRVEASGVKGILRARHTRAPPNTPTPSVRFADTWLTPLKSQKRYGKTRSPSTPDKGTSLPAAQISGGPRWTRLSRILAAIEGDEPITPGSPVLLTDVESMTLPRASVPSSSDSPISFARFDSGGITSSIPPHRPRARQCVPGTPSSPSESVSSETLAESPSPRAESSIDPNSSSSDNEEVFEGCSALEALWEYGSSDCDDESDVISNVKTDPVTPQRLSIEHKEESLVVINTAKSEDASDWATFEPADNESGAFPFATALKF